MDLKTAHRLRTRLATSDRTGPGRGYPPALREEVVVFVRSLGASVRPVEVADALGLPAATLARWLHGASPEAASFRPLQVIDVEGRPDGLVLHAPCGVRIEGLDLESLAALLRRLGA